VNVARVTLKKRGKWAAAKASGYSQSAGQPAGLLPITAAISGFSAFWELSPFPLTGNSRLNPLTGIDLRPLFGLINTLTIKTSYRLKD
jgi:hypothetical protein